LGTVFPEKSDAIHFSRINADGMKVNNNLRNCFDVFKLLFLMHLSFQNFFL